MAETTAADPPAPAPPSSEAPEPLKLLGRIVAAFLVAVILADLAAAAVDFEQLRLFDRLAAGEDVPFDELDASDRRLGLTGLLQTVAYVTTIIAWLVWFRRAYANLERLAPADRRYGTGWAVGAWFVPFLNLVRPKKIANDIWRAADPHPPAAVPFLDRPVPVLLHLWWAAWVLVNFVGNVAARSFGRAETVADQRDAASVGLTSDLLSAGSGVVAVAVVLAMTRRYERRRSQIIGD